MKQTLDRETLKLNYEEAPLQCEECQMPLWRAGEVVPAGTYVRMDDRSYRTVVLDQVGPLPATFDGHVALYCTSGCACRDHANRRPTVHKEIEKETPEQADFRSDVKRRDQWLLPEALPVY